MNVIDEQTRTKKLCGDQILAVSLANFCDENGYGVGACHDKPDCYGWLRGFAITNPYILPI